MRPAWIPVTDWSSVQGLASSLSSQPDVLSGLTAAIGKHETDWGQLGAGRQGYYLGVGVPSSGAPLQQYSGLQNQLGWAMPRLAAWFRDGTVTFDRLVQFARNVWKPDDPESWARGVYTGYQSVSKTLAQAEPASGTGVMAFWNDPAGWIRTNVFTDQVIIFLVAILLLYLGLWGMMKQ